ncbi:MAG: hypothetical protein ACKVT2_09640 [Saprospiraceae bacterium]
MITFKHPNISLTTPQGHNVKMTRIGLVTSCKTILLNGLTLLGKFSRQIEPRRIAIRVMFFASLSNALHGQNQVELSSDSNHVETGNPLGIQIRIPGGFGKPDSINFDVWERVLPVQNIVKESEWETAGPFFIKRLTALFFDADTLELPALCIALPNGDSVYSNSIKINVLATPSPDDLNDMAPIKDIHREPKRWTDFLPWILGGLAMLIIIAGLFWLLNLQHKSSVLSRVIQTPPHELALKKLDALAQKELVPNGFIKEHYAQLSFILREYLEKRFEIPALESTTEETLSHLRSRNIAAQIVDQLQQLLEQADLAKFAKIVPPESFYVESMENARKLIFQTVDTSKQSIIGAPATTTINQ